MDHDYNRTVSAFYESRASADAHRHQLEAIGVPSSDITIVEGADASEPNRAYEEKGFFESIGDFIMGDDDRHVYNEGLRRGGYLLTARVDADHYDAAVTALDTDEAVDMDERSESWRSDGWAGVPAAGSAGYGMSSGAGYDNTTSAGFGESTTGDYDTTRSTSMRTGDRDDGVVDGTIEVMQEDVRIGKRDVSHGRVRVRSYVVEEDVSEDVELRNETVDIERRRVDRPVTAGDAAFREQVIEAEEHDEEAVVSKEARVVEEIDLKKRVDVDTQRVTETVRHTEVEIEDERTGGTRSADRDRL